MWCGRFLEAVWVRNDFWLGNVGNADMSDFRNYFLHLYVLRKRFAVIFLSAYDIWNRYANV